MMAIERVPFGEVAGREVSLFTLRNAHGMTARITDYGGILTELRVPDRDGDFADVVLGFDTLDGYLGLHPYFGALVGRYANRIGGAAFAIDGVAYRLAANEPPNHLHGGVRGFDKAVWRAEPRESAEGPALALAYVSSDGEEGYPGTLTVEAVYTLGGDGALDLAFTARTDTPTVVNLVNHAYWNLAGHDAGDVLGHRLRVHAAAFTPTDAALIPTGEVRPVAGTPYDFTDAKPVGRDRGRLGEGRRGYDVNFVLDGAAGRLRPAAVVFEPGSGRVMEVLTTAPGVQLYDAHNLDGTLRGKGGSVYGPGSGLCLETQHFPDSPNRPGFPSAVLRPGETYAQRTVYRFSTRPPPAA